MFRKKQPPAHDLSPQDREAALARVPMVNPHVSTSTTEAGYTLLTYEIVVKPWFAGLAKRMGTWDSAPTIKKLELDELGTYCFGLIDGKRSVARMIDTFAKEYQLHPREAEVAVTAFIRELGKREILGLG